MPSNSAGLSAPLARATDSTLDARWSERRTRCREHDREGRRRLRLALMAVVTVGIPLAISFGMPWAAAR